MRKKLFSNWGLKLLSILLALVLWIVVVYIDNPPEDRAFQNIPVKLINTNELTDKNKVYEILEGTDTVKRVTVKAPKSVLSNLTSGDIVAVADCGDITTLDTIPIQLSVPQYRVSDIKVSGGSEMVKLFVDDKKVKNIPLKAETKGEVAEGYELNSVKAEQNRITISGAGTRVDKVSYAAVTVDITDITTDLYTTETIRLYDENGAQVEEDYITMNTSNSKVSVGIYATKYVPIKYTVMGTPADGYRATGVVESSPETVKIAGSSSILNNISEITIPEEQLNITGQTENLLTIYNIKDYLPAGVQLAEGGFNGTISVTVYIEKEVQKKLNIPASNVILSNLPAGLSAERTDEGGIYTVQVKGLSAGVSLLRENTLRGTVDIAAWMEEQEMTELSEGSYSIPVNFELGEGVALVQPLYFQVNISKRDVTGNQ